LLTAYIPLLKIILTIAQGSHSNKKKRHNFEVNMTVQIIYTVNSFAGYAHFDTFLPYVLIYSNIP
jgi:hypothetical protein